MHRIKWPTVGITAIVVLAGGLLATPANAANDDDSLESRSGRLATELRQAISEQDFTDILDKAPPGTQAAKLLAAQQEEAEPTPEQLVHRFANATPAPIHQQPNVDATVIELNQAGRPISAANVLFSPQYPKGIQVPLDHNLATDQVRWREWDDAQWDNNKGQGTKDAVPGHEDAPIDFMSLYPASVLKLMVGFGVLQLVDKGEISLGDNFTYQPIGTPSSLCGGTRSASITQFFDEMITFSSNASACALIKLLHEHQAIDSLNQTFSDIGLEMLQLKETNPNTGGRWTNSVTMNSLDTAKLLLIVSGAPGTLWKAPNGTKITKDLLSDSSRQFFLSKLGDQGLNQVLSTTNWCSRDYPAPGIPQLTPQRWINPTDGTVTIAGRVFGQDVRPCNEAAEVTFAHKTGFVDTSGNDAGIVHSLPGKPGRNYIVVVNSNLGDRYIDSNRPADPPGITPVVHTEKLATLGRRIDEIITDRRDDQETL